MKRRTRRRWRRLLQAMTVVAACYGGGFGLFLVLLPQPYLDMVPETDGLAVFTGGSNRVTTGLQYVQDGYAGPVLLSGVHPHVRMRELMAMVPLTERQQAQITLDTLAENTRSNVINTIRWADARGVRSIGVVTSTYHALRCRIWFWWYGARDRVRMIPVQPVAPGMRHLLTEYNKLLLMPVSP